MKSVGCSLHRNETFPEKIAHFRERGSYVQTGAKESGETITEREHPSPGIAGIFQFRADLAEWKTILELVEKTETYVRTQGLFLECDQELRPLLRLASQPTERTIRMRWSLIEYVLDESLKAQPGECLLGDSEVIESVFGKFKYMQREHEKGSLTAMVLAIPAMVSQTTQDVVLRALEAVPHRKCGIR